MDSLASLRMDATSLKAVLSNEVFRLRQSCSKESRLIENLFGGLIEGILEQKDGILQRLNKQSTSLVGEINTSMKKIDTNLRAMDKIFETMPVGKRMTRTEVDSLHELLKKTEINVSHAPKKLTLSEVNEHNMEDFVEDISNSLNEKLNFQVFEQDFEVIQTFNRKVARIKSEFNSMIETVDTRPRSSKLLPFEHNDVDKLRMLRPNTDSFKRSEVNFGLDENKENRLDLLNLPDINMSSNKINKIQLECDEKLQLFRDCFQNDFNRESVNLSDLECSDENLLPKLHSGLEGHHESNHYRKPSDSNILIDEDVIDTDLYDI